MLLSIHIENVALIKETDIDFSGGFTVLTGETGAGKSILIDSINMITGRRTTRDMIRTGENFCFVGATFAEIDDKTKAKISQLGFECEDDSIMLSKTLYADGRSISKINTRTVPQTILKSVSSILITINGQNDSYSLIDNAYHLEYVDLFAYDNIEGFSDLKSEYQNIFEAYNNIKSKLDDFTKKEKDRRSRIDFLKFQTQEIEGAKIKIGEEDNLLSQKAMLLNSEKISSSVKGAYHSLMGASNRTSAYDRLIYACEQIEAIKDMNPQLTSVYEKLNDLSYEIEALSEEISKFVKDGSENPEIILDKIESRLDTIYKIKKKYGMEDKEILEYCEGAKKEIESLEEYDVNLKKLSDEFQEYRIKCIEKSVAVNTKRKAAADLLKKSIETELAFLEMETVKFSVIIEDMPEPNENGCGRFGFYVSTNIGEPLKPIESVASGGELSRLMLALKTVLAKSYDVGTVIFDEIDTGLSGKTSRKIGISLKRLSNQRQVIAVTHSAQVASASDNHYKISKEETEGRMVTSVTQLSRDERIEEIARILGGVTITKTVMESAKELIDEELI